MNDAQVDTEETSQAVPTWSAWEGARRRTSSKRLTRAVPRSVLFPAHLPE